MFASRVKKVVEFADGTVTIRKLSYRSLDKAKDARSAQQLGSMREMGGDILKALRSEELDKLSREVKAAAAVKAADPKELAKARYAEYDHDSVLVAGIDSWSYGEVTPQAIYDLDQDRATQLHQEILDLSLPPLDAAEVQAKN